MTLSIVQSGLIFSVSLAVVIAIFCVVGCYYRRKQRSGQDIDEDELLNRNTAVEIEMEPMPMKNLTAKLNLSRMEESNRGSYYNQTAKNIMGSLDSKRSTRTAVSTPKMSNATNRGFSEPEENVSFIPTMKHTFSSKLAKYTQRGIEVLNKNVLTVRKSKVFRDLQWKHDIVENSRIQRHFYPINSPNFFEQMQYMGLQPGTYTCVKELTHLDLLNVEAEKEYLVKDLSCHKAIEDITDEQYQKSLQITLNGI